MKWITKERIPVDQIVILDPSKEFIVFTGYSLCYLLIVFAFSLVIKLFPLPILHATSLTDDFWYVFFIKIFFLLIVPVVIYLRLGYNISSLFEYKHPTPGRNIILIVIGLSIGMIMNLSHIPGIIAQLQRSGPHALQLTAAIIIPFIAAALPEELFYRVILQTRIEKKYGWFWSIILSSVLFCLFHFPSRFILSSGIEGTAGKLLSIVTGTLIPVFIVGLILGFLWNRYRNLLLLLALHYSIDLLPAISSMLGIKL
jgi:uncharacterized protein